MAISKRILKKLRQQAVVKFVSDGSAGGSANVTLAELALADETFNANTAIVTIQGTFNSIDSLATISRNSSNVLVLSASQQDKWDFNQAWGFVLDDNANSRIDVNFSGDGTIILILGKKSGYDMPSYQTMKDYEK